MHADSQERRAPEPARKQGIPTKAQHPAPSGADTPDKALGESLPTSDKILEASEARRVVESCTFLTAASASDPKSHAGAMKPLGNKPVAAKSRFPRSKPGERLAFGQIVELPFSGSVVLRNRGLPPSSGAVARTAMKVSVQDNLVPLRRCSQPLAKDGILPDRRLLVVIGNYQEGHSVHSGRRKVVQHAHHHVSSERAYIVNGNDKGPARRLHLLKACVNGMVLINV